MRGKLAKELRVMAREMCEADGAIHTKYVGGAPPEFKELPSGALFKTKRGSPLRLDNKCERFFYKYLKGKVGASC